MALNNLFSPVTINGLELKNRAVMPAMGTGYGALDGTVTDRLTAYLERRARGGVGLISPRSARSTRAAKDSRPR